MGSAPLSLAPLCLCSFIPQTALGKEQPGFVTRDDLLQKEGCWWLYLNSSACSLSWERQRHQLVPSSSVTMVMVLGCCTAVWQFLGKPVGACGVCKISKLVVTKAFPAC